MNDLDKIIGKLNSMEGKNNFEKLILLAQAGDVAAQATLKSVWSGVQASDQFARKVVGGVQGADQVARDVVPPILNRTGEILSGAGDGVKNLLYQADMAKASLVKSMAGLATQGKSNRITEGDFATEFPEQYKDGKAGALKTFLNSSEAFDLALAEFRSQGLSEEESKVAASAKIAQLQGRAPSKTDSVERRTPFGPETRARVEQLIPTVQSGRTLDALVGDWSENLIAKGITNTDVNSKEVSKETIVDKMKKTPTRKSLGGMRMAGRYGAGILAALAGGYGLSELYKPRYASTSDQDRETAA
ncbi:MAG: hypothetical protein CMB76_06640 [Euryarchaeota archaeon]|nr:hypothetical protein [Euryarchaeota archaeon]|tara:strand:- start:1082 stop:1990 length:909 start_codon:yes stop_codon:yes gene_type:complete